MRTLIAALSLALIAVTGQAADFTAREGGPDAQAMQARHGTTPPAEGLDFFRPVLSGVLYRAGFKGGDKGRTGLDGDQRRALCEAGFSTARYIDFGKNTEYSDTACGAGRMSYAPARSTRPAETMRAIHAIAQDPARGPMVAHCMWGVHSSGAISAMALVQFCGWSEDRAKAYWDETRNGAPCSGGCDAWIDRHFAKFERDPALTLSDAQRAAICPR
jgi:hypothetical protein